MRKITESQYKKIVILYNDAVDKKTSAMITVYSSWGRCSEIPKLQSEADSNKLQFLNEFTMN